MNVMWWSSFFRTILRRDKFSQPESRTVFVNNKPPPGTEEVLLPKYAKNKVKTSKYTIWNFVPKNLFEQFRRIANFYFLVVAIIQLSIDSPVSPVTSIAPLIMVVIVTAAKQAYEDYLRHKEDIKVNRTPIKIVRGGVLLDVTAREIQVGDIVYLHKDCSFPCDLVLLSSSDPAGECLLTTANLDGETNLKIYHSVAETKLYCNEQLLEELHATIECEHPSNDLYKFVGRIFVHTPQGKKVFALNAENLLLRGASMRNTDYAFGCAVYTGPETKLALNSKLTRNKFSTIEKSMNIYLAIYLAILLFEVGLCTGLKYRYMGNPVIGTPAYVAPKEEITAKAVIQDILSFLVLFNYIIPISMYVTIEFVKFLGSKFFEWDEELYDIETDQYAKCNSSDLNEELGQVQYLFTDKTGTLTENDMQFRQCSINGLKYMEYQEKLSHIPESVRAQPIPVQHMTEDIEQFLLVLVLCHTAHISKGEPVNNNNSKGKFNLISKLITAVESIKDPSSPDCPMEYQASSPDEKALLDACKRFGVTFLGIYDGYYTIEYLGERRMYKRLHVLEFDADRKRMSVIVRTPQGDPVLLCKGAESAVLERCITGEKEATLQHVNDYALLGLRTLVVANRKLTEEQYKIYDDELLNARQALVDRESKVAKVFDLIERDLHLLGATGVEDRLQDGVPETLECLKLAGIKVWVLTGDKVETAVNISYSCGHFKRYMSQLQLVNQKNSLDCATMLETHKKKMSEEPMQSYGLVVDGGSLTIALGEMKDLFYEVATNCTAVVCCRMSPIQKAQIVRLIKKSPSKPITAAIGDGANDVSMIQEAHVGFGIMGKEGRQAVRCSDFAFARFKFLLRVLLVHGHYYYIRVATLVQYFFYKNVAFITPQVYYQFFSAFSSQPLYGSMFLTLYNILFSSMPILVFGLFEKNISSETLLKQPELYRTISNNALLTPCQFIRWLFLGVWHSIVFFGGAYLLFYFNAADVALSLNAKIMSDYITFSTLIFHVCVITVNLKIALEARYFTVIFILSLIITVVGFTVFTIVYSLISKSIITMGNNAMFFVYINILSSPACWFAVVAMVVSCMVPDLAVQAVCHHIPYIKKRLRKHFRVGEYKTRLRRRSSIYMIFSKRRGQVTISQINIVE